MRTRYARTASCTMSRFDPPVIPRLRPASATLAARRLTSHSHGAGSVSSKSLTSKNRFRSGVAKTPKFPRWASPHACTRNAVVGVVARSSAINTAEPRMNANGDTSMRP